MLQELIDHEAPCRHKLAVHVVPTADGVAGRGANVLHAASDGEVVDGFAPPPPGKEVSSVHLHTTQLFVTLMYPAFCFCTL